MRTTRCACFFFVACVICKMTTAFGDVSVKSGLCFGSISQVDQSRNQTIQADVGGIPGTFAYNLDLSTKFSIEPQASLLFDLKNKQLVRHAAGSAFFYHAVGGARKHRLIEGVVEVAAKQSFSVGSRIDYANYGIVDKENPSLKIKGSLIELYGGLQYRRNWSENADYGFELMVGMLSFAASTDVIQSRLIELTAIWRFGA